MKTIVLNYENRLFLYMELLFFTYENLYRAIIYTIGHILVAMTCNRIITGASLDMAAADAFVEPIINGFWFYFLLVYLKKTFITKIESSNSTFISINQIGFLLAFFYTIGHILIAMTCNRLLTGAPLNLAAIDAFIEPLVNGFWFYLLFEYFNKFSTYEVYGFLENIFLIGPAFIPNPLLVVRPLVEELFVAASLTSQGPVGVGFQDTNWAPSICFP